MSMFIWGVAILSKHEGKYFSEKVPSSSTSYPAIPCWKWLSINGKCPLCTRVPWNSIVVEKACGKLTSLSRVVKNVSTLMDSNAS